MAIERTKNFEPLWPFAPPENRRAEYMARMRTAGFTIKEIARYFNISCGRAQQILASRHPLPNLKRIARGTSYYGSKPWTPQNNDRELTMLRGGPPQSLAQSLEM